MSIPNPEWERELLPGSYPRPYTIRVLREHADLYHPVTRTVRNLISASERIIHTLLGQAFWWKNEIQHRNMAFIGDASRALLPSSRRGTSFAIEDATVLANALLNNGPSEYENAISLATALQEYARLRVDRSKRVADMAWYAGKLDLGETWYRRELRDLGTCCAIQWRTGKIVVF